MDIALLLVGLLAGAGLATVARLVVGRRDEQSGGPAPAPERLSTGVGLAALEHHPAAVLLTDADGGVLYQNQASRAWAGTHVGVLVDEAVERHVDAASAGEPGSEVLDLYGPPRRVMVLNSHPLPGGGAVVFVDDISERRRLDQVRTDFVANLSHELKTPIGALAVLAETLADEATFEPPNPATVARLVDRITTEAERASRTLDDLMELSRIEAGAESTTEPVKLRDVVRGAVERVTELAARRDITITTLEPSTGAPDRDELLVVDGDRRQLISAVGNLVENSVKYSNPGGQVQVRLRRADPWIEIMVVDQGVGIPQRDLDRIFERFYRVDRARSRDTGGTGLGLSIVRHVAQNHSGEVVVSSIEGEGSTFVLRFKSSERNAEVAASADTTDERGQP